MLAGLPFLVELAFVASLWSLLSVAENERSKEIIYRKGTAINSRLFAQFSLAPYFLILGIHTKSEKLLSLFDNEFARAKGTFAELNEFYVKHKSLNPNLDNSASNVLINRMFDLVSNMRKQTSNTGPEEPLPQYEATAFCEIQTNIRGDLSKSFQLGDKELLDCEQNIESNHKVQQSVLLAGLVINVIIGVCLWLLYKRSILDRIKTIATNTEAIVERGWLIPEMGGSDEISSLDHAFHIMHKNLLKSAEIEKSLFQNASDVIFVLNAQNKFTQINPAGEKSWGYPIERLMVTEISRFLLEDDAPRVMEHINRAKSGEDTATFEAALRTRDARILYGLWSIYWSEDTDCLYGIFHDITEQRSIKEQRKAYVAMISSDLQKPLLKIDEAFQQLVSVQHAGELSEKAREKVSTAGRNLKRLLGLVKELVQFTEMESGTLELNQATLQLGRLLQDAASEVHTLAAAKQIELEVNCTAELAYGDGDKVMQVLVNLLSNAIKFSENNSKVQLNARPHMGMVRIEVTDHGRGIPENQKHLVFEKFKQVEASDSKRKAGTGLGLPICKDLVEKHGGQIGVDSEEGKGSTFWFTLYESQPTAVVPSSVENSLVPLTKGPTGKLAKPGSQTAVLTKQLKAAKGFWNLKLQGLLLIGLPLIFELVFVSGMAWSLTKVQAQRGTELHMRKIAFDASKGLKALLDLSGQMMCEEKRVGIDFSPFEKKWDSAYEQLIASIGSDERFAKATERLKKAYDRAKAAQFQPSLETNQAAVLDMAMAMMTMTASLDKIIETAEVQEYADPALDKKLLDEQKTILIYGLTLNAALSIALSLFFAINISRRLIIMADNTQRLANETELNPTVGGADEIAELDISFHLASRRLNDNRRRERAVFDNCKDVLAVIGKDGKLVSLNPAGERAWGVEKSELEKAAIEQLIVPEDRQSLNEVILGVPDKAVDVSLELRVAAKETEKPGWTLWTITRTKGQRSSYCVVRDISDRKQLEQLRQEFLAVVSHDLRTPLSSVMGVVNLLGAGAFGAISETTKEIAATIDRNCHSLLELIGDILDLEKLEAGQMTLNLSPVQLKDLNKMLHDNCKRIGIILQSSASGAELDKPVEADIDRLLIALMNLLKYLHYRVPRGMSPLDAATNAKTRPVNIQFRQSSPGVEFYIYDSSPEIPPAIASAIFERTKSADLQETSHNPAFRAELALPLAKRIFESHGGKLELKTKIDSNCFVGFIAYKSIATNGKS